MNSSSNINRMSKPHTSVSFHLSQALKPTLSFIDLVTICLKAAIIKFTFQDLTKSSCREKHDRTNTGD